jgi:hypothetical protein
LAPLPPKVSRKPAAPLAAETGPAMSPAASSADMPDAPAEVAAVAPSRPESADATPAGVRPLGGDSGELAAVASEGCAEGRQSKVKTFLRKDRRKGSAAGGSLHVLPSLSNRVTMNSGVNVSIAVSDLPTLSNNNLEQAKSDSWNKITDLVSRLAHVGDTLLRFRGAFRNI